MPGRRDSITGRDRSRDSRCKSVFVPTRLMFSVLFVIVLFINTNSNINRHVLLSFIETARISRFIIIIIIRFVKRQNVKRLPWRYFSDSPKKNLVLERWLSVVPASTKRQRRRRPGLDCGNGTCLLIHPIYFSIYIRVTYFS